MFLLVDIICCCAIIFPIVWSIRSLKETSKTNGKEGEVAMECGEGEEGRRKKEEGRRNKVYI